MKNMTLQQELGMVTLRNTVRLLLDKDVDFTTFYFHDVYTKGITLSKIRDIGEMDVVESIEFVLYPDKETVVRMINPLGDVMEMDTFKFFEMLTNELC